MARDEEPEAVRRADAARGARCPRVPGERGKLAVGDDVAARHGAQRLDRGSLERRAPAEVEVDVGHVDVVAGEQRAEPLLHFRREVGTHVRVLARKTA